MASGMMGEDPGNRYRALVQKVQDNSAIYELLKDVYDQYLITFWMREALTAFIEETDWFVEADDQRCVELFSEFINQLTDATECGNGVDRLMAMTRYTDMSRFQERYGHSPQEFVEAMKMCMKTEHAIIEGKTMVDSAKVLKEAFDSLTSTIKTHLDNVQRNSPRTRQQKMRKVDPATTEETFAKSLSDALGKILDAGNELVKELAAEKEGCLNDVQKWREEQNQIKYKSMEGVPKLTCLDDIERRFQAVYDKCTGNMKLLTDVKNLVTGMVEHNWITGMEKEKEILKGILTKVDAIKTELEERSVVIEEQPPQIIEIKDKKTKSKESFNIKLRSFLNLKVRIGTQDLKMMRKDDYESERESPAKVVCTPHTVGNRTNLDKITIANFERQVVQNILFDPYVFLVPITLEGKSIKIYTNICMLGSHTQLSKAQGYLLWSWAFSKYSQSPFEMEEEVTWNALHPVLSEYFRKETGYVFTEDNINSLEEMFSENVTISWKKLVTETSPHCSKSKDGKHVKNFTIWDWLCGAKNILKEYPDLCKQRLIHGFLTKNRADDMLKDKPDGTFLLRFSHTFLDGKTTPRGGLSVAVKTWNTKKGKSEVLHSAPFSMGSDKVEPLPKETSIGLWLSNFVLGSNEKTTVKLSFLCGKSEPVEETFKCHMLVGPERPWKDYVPLRKKMVLCTPSDPDTRSSVASRDDLVQEKINEIVQLAGIPLGVCIYIQPVGQLWNIMYDEPQPQLSSVGSSPAQSTDDDCTMSPATECYASATEDLSEVDLAEQMDISPSPAQMGELMQAISLIDDSNNLDQGVNVTDAIPNGNVMVTQNDIQCTNAPPLFQGGWNPGTPLNTPPIIPSTVDDIFRPSP